MPILNSIQFQLSLDDFGKEFRSAWKNSSLNFQELLETAQSLITPKLLYKVCYVNHRENNRIEIEDVIFSSHVLSVNLQKIGKVFPYVITIGSELEDEASSMSDLLQQYYLESIGDVALRSVKSYLENHIRKKFGIKTLSSMSPGSLEDWPITQQKPLFALFGSDADSTGIRLTEKMLMIPRKSISGILFPTEVTFSSCKLCPRKNCPARKAIYDENLMRKYELRDGK
ncbi:MAG: vitamin B12 dependent-methionine synthase activation domain-containing protein [Candidatus Aminicenantes bacterium]|jgi:hypothetical protein